MNVHVNDHQNNQNKSRQYILITASIDDRLWYGENCTTPATAAAPQAQDTQQMTPQTSQPTTHHTSLPKAHPPPQTTLMLRVLQWKTAATWQQSPAESVQSTQAQALLARGTQTCSGTCPWPQTAA